MFDKFLLGFFPGGSEISAEAHGIGCVMVGGEQIAVDVSVAHCSGCTAQVAERALERLGLLFDAGDIGGENEQFECGFDSSRGGAQSVDAFGGCLFEACCNSGL